MLTYPDVQQMFGKWDGNGDVALTGFSSITSDFAEGMKGHSGTDVEAAYDIWLSGTSRNEVMIWVDNASRGNGGGTLYGHATIGGRASTVYTYGSGEIIVSWDRNETSGTVDILATLKWLQAHGLVSSSAALGQVDFGWEICSTGGQPETFNKACEESRLFREADRQQIQPHKQVRDQRLHGLMRMASLLASMAHVGYARKTA